MASFSTKHRGLAASFKYQKDSTPEMQPLSDAYDAWKLDNTPATRQGFVQAASPVIDTAIRSFGGPAAGNPNLKSRAKLLAVQSLPTYDPKRGELKTHLLTQLQRLRRIGGQQETGIRVPERLGLARRTLQEAESKLLDELGREASDPELADTLGVSMKMLGKIRRASIGISTSQSADPETGMEQEKSVDRSAGDEAWLDFVYGDLGPKDQLIVDYSLGRNGRPKISVNEIARRLHVTPAAISQRAAKIQQLLDTQTDLI